ncbi:MAG TPA: hypothetical protein VI299_30335 [Polyangiales bacterium]
MERNHELDPQRVCTLVLARLLPENNKGHARANVVKSVAALLPGVNGKDSAERAWDEVLAKSWADNKGRLTAGGRRELSERLRVEKFPNVRTWADVQRLLLGPIALGMPAPAVKGADFAADVVCAVHSFSATSLRAAVDRLAWRALGVETEMAFTPFSVQRHLLRELVPRGESTPEKFRKQVAARFVQSNDSRPQKLREAALRQWVRGGKLATPVTDPAKPESRGLVVIANDNTNRAETSLERFAEAVMDTARKPGVTRFHDDRAFIGSIWEHMRGRSPVFEMPLDAFKEKLVQAHRQKLIRMSRADLVQAMDPAEVARSEARYLSATFHFVALQAGGAR